MKRTVRTPRDHDNFDAVSNGSSAFRGSGKGRLDCMQGGITRCPHSESGEIFIEIIRSDLALGLGGLW